MFVVQLVTIDPYSMLNSLAVWATPFFESFLPIALSALGMFIGALLLRFLFDSIVGAIKSLTGISSNDQEVPHTVNINSSGSYSLMSDVVNRFKLKK
jgi:hypothetical protein